MQGNANIWRLVDLTSLNETDNAEGISALCQKALEKQVAAVCVYPQFVQQVKKHLSHSAVRIATVVNFPQGNDELNDVTAAIKQVIADGANEVDVVFPYQAYLQGDKVKPFDFIRACKAACGESVLLKVILETGMLQDPGVISEVSYHVSHAGADFLKTSTGKVAVGATPEAVQAMLTVLHKIPRAIGLKVSGGVRTIEKAQQYIQQATDIMGAQWIVPANFRIGASQLG